MSQYLTNTSLANEGRCIEAAKNSGFKVIFHRFPMPAEPWEDDGYSPAGLVGIYGCVETLEPPERDHGPFWDEWDRLKSLSAKGEEE